MSEDLHQRAGRLMAADRVEGLAADERVWLDEHLEQCAGCAARARATEKALQALRAVSVPVRDALVATTQLRVRLRARELADQRARMRALWIACAGSWILGAVTAPLLWRAFAWVGRSLALPDILWEVSFAFWWFTPAAAVGGVLAWWRSQVEKENGFGASLPR